MTREFGHTGRRVSVRTDEREGNTADVLIEGGVTRKRLAIPPMEKPISWVDITSIQLSG